MKNQNLDKKFKHHSWFIGGVTVRYALDYFAKTGFYLDKKRTSTKELKLFSEEQYDDVLRSDDYRDQATYKLNEEEKAYFLERVEYWKERKEIERQEWLNSEVNLDKSLRNFLAGNSYYDVAYAERQRDIWDKKHNDLEMVQVWEGYVAERKQSKAMMDKLITKHRDTIKTNKDFIAFKELIEREVYDKFPA